MTKGREYSNIQTVVCVLAVLFFSAITVVSKPDKPATGKKGLIRSLDEQVDKAISNGVGQSRDSMPHGMSRVLPPLLFIHCSNVIVRWTIRTWRLELNTSLIREYSQTLLIRWPPI